MTDAELQKQVDELAAGIEAIRKEYFPELEEKQPPSEKEGNPWL